MRAETRASDPFFFCREMAAGGNLLDLRKVQCFVSSHGKGLPVTYQREHRVPYLEDFGSDAIADFLYHTVVIAEILGRADGLQMPK